MKKVANFDDLLSKVAEKLNWFNFEVSSDMKHESGNGFLGEFFMTSIVNKETHEKKDLAIKKAFQNPGRREEINIPVAFKNEIYFYEIVAPILMDFKGSLEGYNFLPQFFVSCKMELEECLVMENLRSSGFDIIGRENLLDLEHVEFIFKTYGKYHALSFAYKDQKIEDYKKMMSKVEDFWGSLEHPEGFEAILMSALSEALNCVDKKIAEDCQEFLKKPFKKFLDVGVYKGKFSCVVHGDCWSNNMMFKYKNGKLDQMKLIDFQLIKEGSPVYDLSYFLYAGGLKEAYQNLDNFLEIYHKSFSTACKELGSDPNKLFPLEALKEDFKKYSKWGIMMALILQKVKSLGQDDVQKMTSDANFMDKFNETKVDSTKQAEYQERIKEIVESAYKKGFLKFYD